MLISVNGYYLFDLLRSLIFFFFLSGINCSYSFFCTSNEVLKFEKLFKPIENLPAYLEQISVRNIKSNRVTVLITGQ